MNYILPINSDLYINDCDKYDVLDHELQQIFFPSTLACSNCPAVTKPFVLSICVTIWSYSASEVTAFLSCVLVSLSLSRLLLLAYYLMLLRHLLNFSALLNAL